MSTITLTPTMTLTRVELKEKLMEKNFSSFISFVSKVPVDMNQYENYWLINDGKKSKNPNPTPNLFFNGIWKISKEYQIVIGFDYEKSVNRRLDNEGKETNFESEGNWFEVLSLSLVTDKKTRNKFYLRYQRQKTSTIGKPEFFYKGDPIEKKLFESFLKEKTNNHEKQGLDNPLQFQVVNLNHLLSISMDGEVYELTGEI